ncbi:MAG: hypothetical protein ACYCUM_02600 [Solirubrobacteraceae bacterium]
MRPNGVPPAASRTPAAPPRPAVAAATPSEERRVEIRGEHTISADVIEVQELVQFRERLEQITRELVDEYSRIIALRPPSGHA